MLQGVGKFMSTTVFCVVYGCLEPCKQALPCLSHQRIQAQLQTLLILAYAGVRDHGHSYKLTHNFILLNLLALFCYDLHLYKTSELHVISCS